jgi:diguanylate cyclase (GGDEF)-like protein
MNIISMKTGWIFYITENNVYKWGPGFWVQQLIVVSLIFIPLIHLTICFFKRESRAEKKSIGKMIGFYMIPVIGTLAALPYAGMPGPWPCAAISIVLIYIDSQDSEILRDSLTGLNNRKTLDSTFSYYTKQITEVKNLYVFLMDLDHFKSINDTYGHVAGDQALIAAADILTNAVSRIQGIVARYGGDEFLIMGFFYGDSNAISFKNQITADFEAWNLQHNLPYKLLISIGFSRYKEGQDLDDVVKAADEKLYEEKLKRQSGR